MIYLVALILFGPPLHASADVVYNLYEFYENVKGKVGFEGMEGPMMVIRDCGVLIPVPGCNGMMINVLKEEGLNFPYVRANWSDDYASNKGSCHTGHYQNLRTGADHPINKRMNGIHNKPQALNGGYLMMNVDSVYSKESRTDPNSPVLIIRFDFKPGACTKRPEFLYKANAWVDYYNQFLPEQNKNKAPVKTAPKPAPKKTFLSPMKPEGTPAYQKYGWPVISDSAADSAQQ
jgi:hypothetical protein